jgi:hypothetical protein
MVSFYFTGYEQFLIPFLFIFAIVYGSLRSADIFKNKKVDAIIALSLGLFAVSNTWLVNFIWSQLGGVSVLFIFMFMLIFIFQVFGVKGAKDNQEKLIILAAILFILFSISYLYTDMIPNIPFIGGGQNIVLLVFIIFIIVIFWLAYKIGMG